MRRRVFLLIRVFLSLAKHLVANSQVSQTSEAAQKPVLLSESGLSGLDSLLLLSLSWQWRISWSEWQI